MLSELGFTIQSPMPMCCDNQTAIFIVNNPMFQERMKHIRVDCYYVRDLVMKKIISTSFTPSSNQLADISQKDLQQVSLSLFVTMWICKI